MKQDRLLRLWEVSPRQEKDRDVFKEQNSKLLDKIVFDHKHSYKSQQVNTIIFYLAVLWRFMILFVLIDLCKCFILPKKYFLLLGIQPCVSIKLVH